MSEYEATHCFLAGALFKQPGKWVDRVCINDKWINARTWIGINKDPARPGAGSSAGQKPRLYTHHMHTLSVIQRMREEGWLCCVLVHQHVCQIGFSRVGQEWQLNEYPSVAVGVALAAEKALRNDT